jgi:hypothetical protein
MPQAWITCTSNSSSSVRIIAGGQAEPPITVRRRVESFSSLAFMWLITPSQTVGTPALKVTPSVLEQLVQRLAVQEAGRGTPASRRPCGALYGRPQALTWNIGTTGRITSAEEQPIASGSAAAIGVQHRRAVAVQRALGVASGTRGVAHAGSGVLVELRPGPVAVLGVHQVLVAQQVGIQAGLGRHVRPVGHQHEMLHRRQRRRDLLDQRQEGERRSTAPGRRRRWRSRRSAPGTGAD